MKPAAPFAGVCAAFLALRIAAFAPPRCVFDDPQRRFLRLVAPFPCSLAGCGEFRFAEDRIRAPLPHRHSGLTVILWLPLVAFTFDVLIL
jgi:hypothetical protein